MTNQITIDKLIDMRLTAMADAFRNQINDMKMKDISFEDRMGMIVDIEFTSRKNNRLKRLIKNAEFDELCNVPGITKTAAKNIKEYFSSLIAIEANKKHEVRLSRSQETGVRRQESGDRSQETELMCKMHAF